MKTKRRGAENAKRRREIFLSAELRVLCASAFNRIHAVENGERSRPGCRSARPRAEPERTQTNRMEFGLRPPGRVARARPAAPEAGALPNATAWFRLKAKRKSPKSPTADFGLETFNSKMNQASARSRLAFKSRLLFAPTICSAT